METTGYPTCTKCKESVDFIDKDGVCTDCSYEEYIHGMLFFFKGYHTAKCEALPNYDTMSEDEREAWVEDKVTHELASRGV